MALLTCKYVSGSLTMSIRSLGCVINDNYYEYNRLQKQEGDDKALRRGV